MADTNGAAAAAAAAAAAEGPGSSSRKRKAENISADLHGDDDAENMPPHLPAPVWGRVLDFMPYAEVRSALLVGKFIAVEAVKYVHTLNIMKSRHMHIPAARRFGNVEEVNILCLLERTTGIYEETGITVDFFPISLDVSTCTVPFLVSFPKLTRGFIGGFDSHGYHQTYDDELSRDHQDKDAYRGLLSAYVGAIKTGALVQSIALKGLDLDSSSIGFPFCLQKSSNCKWCRDILMHYPLKDLFPFLAQSYFEFCHSEQEYWDIVCKRPDVDKGFSEVSEHVLCENVFDYLEVERVTKLAAAVEHLPEKWQLAARQCKNLRVYSITSDELEELDKLIGKGFDPKYVTRAFALERWKHVIGVHSATHVSLFSAWTRATVEDLAARGLPVDCDCIPVIDDNWQT